MDRTVNMVEVEEDRRIQVQRDIREVIPYLGVEEEVVAVLMTAAMMAKEAVVEVPAIMTPMVAVA